MSTIISKKNKGCTVREATMKDREYFNRKCRLKLNLLPYLSKKDGDFTMGKNDKKKLKNDAKKKTHEDKLRYGATFASDNPTWHDHVPSKTEEVDFTQSVQEDREVTDAFLMDRACRSIARGNGDPTGKIPLAFGFFLAANCKPVEPSNDTQRNIDRRFARWEKAAEDSCK
jgi:hypothetical protein